MLWTFTAAGWQGGSDFIVPQKSPDFSVTMTENALEATFGCIVPEKELCFSGTMRRGRSGKGFLVAISQQCFQLMQVLKNKSMSL